MHSLHYYSLDFRAIRHSTLDERRRHLGTRLAVKMLQVADGDQASGLTWSCFNCANDSIERYWLRGVIGSVCNRYANVLICVRHRSCSKVSTRHAA
jgi:hypothetical protein